MNTGIGNAINGMGWGLPILQLGVMLPIGQRLQTILDPADWVRSSGSERDIGCPWLTMHGELQPDDIY